MMLAAIQEAPVSTIADETIEDAAIALSMLRQVTKEVLGRGWHFNTDYDYVLSVDGSGNIPIPTTASHVDPERSTGKDYVRRGDFLYDRENQTYDFTAGTSVKCRIIWMFDYEDLPQTFRTYIAMRAANRFTQQTLGDEGNVHFSKEELMMARAEAVADDVRRSDVNMLTGSVTNYNVIRRRRQWRV
jgi:hypothetical protein